MTKRPRLSAVRALLTLTERSDLQDRTQDKAGCVVVEVGRSSSRVVAQIDSGSHGKGHSVSLKCDSWVDLLRAGCLSDCRWYQGTERVKLHVPRRF